MREIEFINFNQVDAEDLLSVVNEQTLRKHLIEHAYFDLVSLKDWIADKANIDSIPGCRVRAVFIGEILAGWCGIQPDDNGFEIAIVLSKKFWGYGKSIFNTIMRWAKELGHEEIMFHLLDTRPEYKTLKSKATKIQKTEYLGRRFTTYFMLVDKWRVY